MRRIAVLLIAFCGAFAQEDPKARAKEIERQAEKALDEGRRADALKLLAEAADLRAGVRKPEPPAVVPLAQAATAALGELDAALAKGDAAAAKAAAGKAREALGKWEADLAAREQRLAPKEVPVEQRLDEIERKIDEISKRVLG
jgi:hypothetical protein